MARVADPKRPEAILEAARRVFIRDGLAAARMADIAAGAGIAVGTLYLYFPSKDAIAKALAAQSFARAAAVVESILAKPLTRAGVTRLVDDAFDAILADESLGALHSAIGGVYPNLAPDAYEETATAIATRLATQIEWRRVRSYDPRTAADMLLILLRCAVLLAVAHPRREREPYASTLAEFLANALLVEPWDQTPA